MFSPTASQQSSVDTSSPVQWHTLPSFEATLEKWSNMPMFIEDLKKYNLVNTVEDSGREKVTPLQLFSFETRFELVEQLLAVDDIDPNVNVKSGMNSMYHPMAQAIVCGRIDIVEALVGKGMDVNCLVYTKTPLIFLAVHGISVKNSNNVFKFLLNNGVDLHSKYAKNMSLWDYLVKHKKYEKLAILNSVYVRVYLTTQNIFPLDVIERICTWVVEV
jgi:hypothetical protein